MRRFEDNGIRIGTAMMAAVLLAAPFAFANPVWPPPPDQARVEFVREIRCEDLGQESGFFGKIGRILGGSDPDENLHLPFDVLPVDGHTVFVVDTGDHKIKVFDLDGNLTGEIGGRGEADGDLNFPTFAAGLGTGILVNDTMNYRVKRFGGAGELLSAFGEEGNGPGTFSRPKGVAGDSDGNVWVVDALFDNIQIFDSAGRLLLIVGGSGQEPGTFWSPAGIGIQDDLVYVADTFNNRIQVLKYLGGGS
jgi:hypothetical protein